MIKEIIEKYEQNGYKVEPVGNSRLYMCKFSGPNAAFFEIMLPRGPMHMEIWSGGRVVESSKFNMKLDEARLLVYPSLFAEKYVGGFGRIVEKRKIALPTKHSLVRQETPSYQKTFVTLNFLPIQITTPLKEELMLPYDLERLRVSYKDVPYDFFWGSENKELINGNLELLPSHLDVINKRNMLDSKEWLFVAAAEEDRRMPYLVILDLRGYLNYDKEDIGELVSELRPLPIKNGCVSLDEELIKTAGLEGIVRVLGVRNRIEVMNLRIFEEYKKTQLFGCN